jgi:hypothetical protein
MRVGSILPFDADLEKLAGLKQLAFQPIFFCLASRSKSKVSSSPAFDELCI